MGDDAGVLVALAVTANRADLIGVGVMTFDSFLLEDNEDAAGSFVIFFLATLGVVRVALAAFILDPDPWAFVVDDAFGLTTAFCDLELGLDVDWGLKKKLPNVR